jgi:hypothetical protein
VGLFEWIEDFAGISAATRTPAGLLYVNGRETDHVPAWARTAAVGAILDNGASLWLPARRSGVARVTLPDTLTQAHIIDVTLACRLLTEHCHVYRDGNEIHIDIGT